MVKLTKKDFCHSIEVMKKVREKSRLSLLLQPLEEDSDEWTDIYLELLATACTDSIKKRKFILSCLKWFCYHTNYGENNNVICIIKRDKEDIIKTIDSIESFYDNILINF